MKEKLKKIFLLDGHPSYLTTIILATLLEVMLFFHPNPMIPLKIVAVLYIILWYYTAWLSWKSNSKDTPQLFILYTIFNVVMVISIILYFNFFPR